MAHTATVQAHSLRAERVRRLSTAHAARQHMHRQMEISGHRWWLDKLEQAMGTPGGHSETKLLQPPLFERNRLSPGQRPVLASQYLRQPVDVPVDETWEAAARNLGAFSNRMPIDPLRASRRDDTPPTLGRRAQISAWYSTGSLRGGEEGLDYSLARTPSSSAVVMKGARVVEGKRTQEARCSTAPTYAQYYQTASIPRHSRQSIGKVGLGSSPTTRSPSALGPTSPIYIEKDRTAEWTSDSTMHPLILSKRPKGWSATPADATPKFSHSLTEAGRDSTRARLRHMISNESPPQIKSFFLDGLDSDAGSEASRSNAGSPSHLSTTVIKNPDPQCAGKGLVHAHDDRCKPGVKVKIAFSFSMESWAQDMAGQVGVLVDRSPHVSGTWRVRFPGVQDLVECSVGLMGRYHLVYAEEDVFEDAGDNSKIVVRTPSKRSLSASPASPASPLRRA